MAAKKKTFESSMQNLEEIVGDLENGELPLDNSIKRYEQGVKLLRECYAFLEKAEMKIRKLVKQQDGTFALEEFEGEEDAE